MLPSKFSNGRTLSVSLPRIFADTFVIDLVLRLTNPSILLDFVHWSHTCLFQYSLSEMTTPRSFSGLVMPRGISFMWYVEDTGLCFRVICCAMNFDSLNNRPAEDDRMTRLLRSSCESADLGTLWT